MPKHSVHTGNLTVMQLRPVAPEEDLPALDRLFDLIAVSDGHRPIGEHKYLDLVHPDPDGQAGLVASVDGEIVGYVAVGRPPGTDMCAMELALHPLHRRQQVIETLLHAGMGQVVDECGGSSVRIWVFQPHYAETLHDMGFTVERELRQLRRSLPYPEDPAVPDDVHIRGFRVGHDEDTWIEVNNAAFAEHPENGAWNREHLADRMRQPWFEAEGVRMAWVGERLAGFCWTKRHDEMGEIFVIGVHPDFQGRSLGRLLMVEGMRSMAERGMTTVMLYVDAGNTAAMSLYESMGFHLDHVDLAFVRRL